MTFTPSATAAFENQVYLHPISCDDALIPWMPMQVKMTLLLSAVAVPINTVFGVTCAILIARNEFPGKLILTSMLDLPFSISPVVTGQLATVASRPYSCMLPCLFACWTPPLQPWYQVS